MVFRLFATCFLLSSFTLDSAPVKKKSALKIQPLELKEEKEIGPKAIVLTEEQQQLLESGKPVFPPIKEEAGKGGAGVAVFRVKAPSNIVWKVIEDFDQYPNWVDGVKKIERYEGKEKNKTYIQFHVGKWFTPTYTYHIVHDFTNKDKGFATWILDDDKSNDLTECVGYWRVIPLKDDPKQSTVEYSVNLYAEGFVLKIIRPILLKSGIKDATSWVKKQAELLASS